MSTSSLLIFAVIGGFVNALDQETGAILWSVPTGGMRAQLCVSGDFVYVVSEGGGFLILQAKDGALVQKVSLSGRGQAPTILIDGERIFVTSGGELQAFNKEGKMLWKNTFEGKGNGALAIATVNKDRQADEY